MRIRGISSRFQLLSPSDGQVLTRYSPVRHYAYLHSAHSYPLASFQYTPSDLHVLSTPPAFILSQDQTLLGFLDWFRNRMDAETKCLI